MSKTTGSLSDKAGVVVFARIVTTIIDLAIVIATIQLLAKTEFAVIGYLLMVHEIARNIATLGFPESVFYFFERVSGSAKRGFVLQTTVILLATAFVAATIILFLSFIAPSILPGWDIASVEQVQKLLPLMALVTVLEIPTWPVTNILLAADRQKESAWYELITSLLTFISLAGPLMLGYGLVGAIYGLSGYAVIRFAGSWFWVNRVLPSGKLSDSSISVKRQVNFSVPLGLSSLVNKLNRYADKVIVSLLLPAAAYAEYTIGAQEVPIIRVIPFAVGSVLISRYVTLQIESKKEELIQLWYKGVQKVSLIVIPLTFVAIISASDLIALIAESESTEYRNAVLPFQVFNLIVLLRVTNYGAILQAFGDTKGVLYLSLNLVAANIILSLPLTLWFGITGTATGTLLANFYNWIITIKRIGKHMEIATFKVLPFKFYGNVLLTALVVAIPVWYLRFLIFSKDQIIIGLVFSVLGYLMMFFIIGSVVGIITKRDRDQFKEWVQMKFLR